MENQILQLMLGQRDGFALQWVGVNLFPNLWCMKSYRGFPSSVWLLAGLSGEHYVLSGEKMWVTNGVYSDFCIASCLVGEGGKY